MLVRSYWIIVYYEILVFKFEGYFSDDAPENSSKGLFSECLVQADTYIDAEFTFLKALAVQKNKSFGN